jgi:hydroxymethylbilane synthase
MREVTVGTLRIGTRSSALALWQANWVRQRLEEAHPGLRVELVEIQTKGDKILDAPLSKIGDKGLFTREIERALLDGEIDLAVHSLKDLPTTLPQGLTLGAVSEREDPRDALVSKGAASLADLPKGGTVATGSLRRRAQLLHLRPDLRVVDIRGNVQTRLRKFDESNWDGMIMARAGLVRLGLKERIACDLGSAQMLSAVSQGALGLEIREGDTVTAEWITPIECATTRAATTAERAFLHALEGGCQVPVAALGQMVEGWLDLEGLVVSLDGHCYLRGRTRGPADKAEQIGSGLADVLLADGADEVLREIRNAEEK